MRLITWNMGRRQRTIGQAWEYLRTELAPDIALLQETRLPESTEGANIVRQTTFQEWCTAIYSRQVPLREHHSGFDPSHLVICRATFPHMGDVVIASMHARTTGKWHDDPVRWCNSAFDVLEPLARDSLMIVGGDLNASRTGEEWWPGSGNGPLFTRIDLGPFFDCHHTLNPKEVQTYFGRTGVPIQDDHLFMSKSLASRLSSCSAVDNDLVRTFSDHIPVCADLDL